MELEVVAVNIDNDVDGVNGWDNSAVSKGLGLERDTKLELDLLKVDLSSTGGNEDGLLEVEVLGEESCGEV